MPWLIVSPGHQQPCHIYIHIYIWYIQNPNLINTGTAHGLLGARPSVGAELNMKSKCFYPIESQIRHESFQIFCDFPIFRTRKILNSGQMQSFHILNKNIVKKYSMIVSFRISLKSLFPFLNDMSTSWGQWFHLNVCWPAGLQIKYYPAVQSK